MVWAGFSAHGKLDLEFVTGCLNGPRYADILQRRLLPFLEEYMVKDVIFQQDIAPAHTSKVATEWFYEQKLAVLDLPARSADMNAIENVRDMLSRAVHEDGKQYDGYGELQEAVTNSWEDLNVVTLKNLSKGMPRRLIELVEKKGGVTSYA